MEELQGFHVFLHLLPLAVHNAFKKVKNVSASFFYLRIFTPVTVIGDVSPQQPELQNSHDTILPPKYNVAVIN